MDIVLIGAVNWKPHPVIYQSEQAQTARPHGLGYEFHVLYDGYRLIGETLTVTQVSL